MVSLLTFLASFFLSPLLAPFFLTSFSGPFCFLSWLLFLIEFLEELVIFASLVAFGLGVSLAIELLIGLLTLVGTLAEGFPFGPHLCSLFPPVPGKDLLCVPDGDPLLKGQRTLLLQSGKQHLPCIQNLLGLPLFFELLHRTSSRLGRESRSNHDWVGVSLSSKTRLEFLERS